MGSDAQKLLPIRRRCCFNPRSRMGSDYGCFYLPLGYLVSIHAPTRGATKHVHAALQVVIVSTHAPTRGATGLCKVSAHIISFNPRSRMGSDVYGTHHTFRRARVSTHAPAWGATSPIALQASSTSSFNPRSRMGSDYSVTTAALFELVFQPTLPHGERLRGLSVEPFIPRVSTHAPAWGAT